MNIDKYIENTQMYQNQRIISLSSLFLASICEDSRKTEKIVDNYDSKIRGMQILYFLSPNSHIYLIISPIKHYPF
jgi:hypothetical protein